MDETTEVVKSFWSKTASEMTVKDNLVMAAAAPAICVGGIVVTGVACIVACSAFEKFQNIRAKRKAAKTETTETESN
jgi:hypothetical protein